MNIVYIILAHKNPDQLFRLVKKLQAPNVTILIHLDKYMDSLGAEQITTKLIGSTDIHFIPRHYVRWGGMSMSHASNEAISQIFLHRYPCDYAILISGQDYPIQPHSSLIQYLENKQGKSLLAFHPLPIENWREGGLPRIQQWHFGLTWITNDALRKKARRYLNLFFNRVFQNRHFPAGFKPYGGSSWWVFSRNCLEYIHSFVYTHPGFNRFFNYVANANELYYQTIVMNSSLATQVENHNLTYIDWSKHGSHPKTLLTEDFDKITSSDKFFARKFDTNLDITILDLIDRQIEELSSTAIAC